MSENNKLKIVFAGGGTGGHIYPGIAVADALVAQAKERNIPVEIYWIGNKDGMDRNIVTKNYLMEGGSITKFYGIPCGKLRRYFSFQNFVDLFKIIGGFFASVRLLRKIKPDCVFSKGGFVSVPPCRAAKMLHIPYYTHECDFTPGLATRLNSKGAKNILVSYSETAEYFKESGKCLVTGNPVRPVFYEDRKSRGFDFLCVPENHQKPVLLILGGSLGALQLNELVVENIGWLKERFIVVHQTGKAFADNNPDVMNSGDDSYKPYAFIYEEMPAVIQCADVVMSRSGANSLWECAVCAKPMVLVPLCGSGTRGDQVDNARYFEKQNGAFVLAGEAATSENLRIMLEKLCREDERFRLSEACRKVCGETRSAEKIAKIILGNYLEK